MKRQNSRHHPLWAQLTWGMLITCLAIAVTAGSSHDAFASSTSVDIVSEDSFAPSGYSWHYNFTGVQVERGFIQSNDISQYYSEDCVPSLAKVGDTGFAAFINGSTANTKDGEAVYSLRYTGGSYTDEGNTTHAIDAIVELTSWKYLEYEEGLDKDPYLVGHPPKNRQTGVFVNNGYSPNSEERARTSLSVLNNLNFYTVGLTDLRVTLTFVEAGTNSPIRVKGHTACIDLDSKQTFSFGGGVAKVEIVDSSQTTVKEGSTDKWLEVGTDNVISGRGVIAADNRDNNYIKGLVEVYFDTGASGTDSLILDFGTSLGRSPWWVSVSFFSMSSEYLANPELYEMDLIKTSREEIVLEEDPVSYTLSTSLPKEGVDVRVGYRLTSLSILDTLDKHLALQGTPLVSLDGQTLEKSQYQLTINDNQLSVTLNSSYLNNVVLNGQTLSIGFAAKIESLPPLTDDGKYIIENSGNMIVDGRDPIKSNTVKTEITPKVIPTSSILVTKRIKEKDVYWPHGNPSFLVRITGTDIRGGSHSYAYLLNITESSRVTDNGYLEESHLFDSIPFGTYVVTELQPLRYSFDSLTSSGIVTGMQSTITLTSTAPGWATFTNHVTSVEGGSGTSSACNHIKIPT